MSISQNNQTESQTFMTALHGISGLLDEWGKLVPEGQYLEGMDLLKVLFHYKPKETQPNPTINQIISNNPIIQSHILRMRMKVRPEKKILTDAEKIKEGKHERCCDCDRIVKKYYLIQHKYTLVCMQNKISKKMERTLGLNSTKKSADYLNFITSIKAAMYKKQALWSWERGHKEDGEVKEGDEGETKEEDIIRGEHYNCYSKWCGEMTKWRTKYYQVRVIQ
jgi:hypothetical protein